MTDKFGMACWRVLKERAVTSGNKDLIILMQVVEEAVSRTGRKGRYK